MSVNKPSFIFRIRWMTAAVATGIMNLGVAGVGYKGVCVPGMNCHGCPWAAGACPIGVGAYGGAMRTVPVLAIGTVLGIGVAVGRLACGYACPFGLLQELVHKIPLPRLKVPQWARYVKYVSLVLLVVVFPVLLGFGRSPYLAEEYHVANPTGDGWAEVEVAARNLGSETLKSVTVQVEYKDMFNGEGVYSEEFELDELNIAPGETVELPVIRVPDMTETADMEVSFEQDRIQVQTRYGLYYCKLCPVGMLEAGLPSLLGGLRGSRHRIGVWTWVRLGVLVFFLVGMVFVSRFFCQVFCPLGAAWGLLAPLAISRIKVDRDVCIECGKCNAVCPVDLDVMTQAGGMECISCGDCIKECPVSAIKRVYGVK